MAKPLIKICGITRVEDGLLALELGADLLGFIRYPKSPRFRPLDECVAVLQEIRQRSPKRFDAVGVYVDAPLATMLEEQRVAKFDRIQLHGSETMEVARQLPVPVIKAIKVDDSDLLAEANKYPGIELLTDAADAVEHGGTGKSYDLHKIKELVRERQVFVAGGVSVANAAGIISRLGPYGLDVSSSLEDVPGVKNMGKMQQFFVSVQSVTHG